MRTDLFIEAKVYYNHVKDLEYYMILNQMKSILETGKITNMKVLVNYITYIKKNW